MNVAANQHSVLVVDDEEAMRALLVDFLSHDGHLVEVARNGKQALAVLKEREFDVMITDLRMPDMDGMMLLKRAKDAWPDMPVVMVTAFSSIDRAVEAAQAGAFFFVTKPFKLADMRILLDKAFELRQLILENQRLRCEVLQRGEFQEMVGHSKAMTEVFRLIQIVADSDSTIMIQGASGTGKELVARAVHAQSRRRNRAFIPVNCSAIPEGLLESELFGHTRGAFTGAYSARTGLFVEASGGTIFLDEIGDLSIALQAKLLRVLQEQMLRPLGSSKEISVDARIIVATNQDLKTAVKNGTFREDLFYRLSVIPIHIPSLADRTEDIPLLVNHFLKKYAARTGQPVKRITACAMDALQNRRWEGNVRELENNIERAVVLTPGCVIDSRDLPGVLQADNPGPEWWPSVDRLMTLGEVERAYIQRVLALVGGSKEKAARILGINRRTLYRMEKRWNAER